jgi:hypothetical protein
MFVGRQQRFAFRVLGLFHLGPVAFVVAVDDAVLFVHHAQNDGLIGRIDRCNRDVAHGSELTAIVEMFVFQTKRRNTSSGARMEVIRSPPTSLCSVSMKERAQAKRSTRSSMMAK